MMRFAIGGIALLGLAACTPPVPDSGATAGVGFGDYQNYSTAREAELTGTAQQPTNVQLPPVDTSAAVAAATPPATATAAAPVATTPTGNAGISDEQDFDAVSSRESIESDRERLAQQRANYQVIEPTALPTREGGGINVVEYALSTTNAVGQAIYRRSNPLRNSVFLRNCTKYPSSDQAQEAFLKAGGPKRDRLNIDPDGDGFACYWDPTPFRNVSR